MFVGSPPTEPLGARDCGLRVARGRGPVHSAVVPQMHVRMRGIIPLRQTRQLTRIGARDRFAIRTNTPSRDSASNCRGKGRLHRCARERPLPPGNLENHHCSKDADRGSVNWSIQMPLVPNKRLISETNDPPGYGRSSEAEARPGCVRRVRRSGLSASAPRPLPTPHHTCCTSWKSAGQLAPVEFDNNFTRVCGGRRAASGAGRCEIIVSATGRYRDPISRGIRSREPTVKRNLVRHACDPALDVSDVAVGDERDTRRSA